MRLSCVHRKTPQHIDVIYVWDSYVIRKKFYFKHVGTILLQYFMCQVKRQFICSFSHMTFLNNSIIHVIILWVILIPHKLPQFLWQLSYVLDYNWLSVTFTWTHNFLFIIYSLPLEQLWYKLCHFMWSYNFFNFIICRIMSWKRYLQPKFVHIVVSILHMSNVRNTFSSEKLNNSLYHQDN